MEKELSFGDEIIVGPNKYKIISVYLDERIMNGYDKIIGLHSESFKEVIAAMPASSVSEYLNNLQLDWKREKVTNNK